MMRHFRVSAASQPKCAVRTKMTGFSLFTQDMQRETRLLKARTFEKGSQNMRIMAKLWQQLPACRRAMYHARARQRDALMARDPEKKNNTFNLLMRLFGSDKVLLRAGDGSFTARMATSTMRAMSSQDVKRLREKLKVDAFFTSKGRSDAMVTSSFKRFISPNMLLFDSFTEMQRSVAPTRKSAFTAIMKLLSVSNFSVSGEEYVMNRYSSLSPEVRNLFTPISDVEAPFFETFCASRCAGFDRKRFDIMKLFASFRGIEVDLGSNPVQEQLFRSLINTDRSHDGIFFRARRSLERLEALRSSDCGLFIAKRLPRSIRIDPTTYSINSNLDDVSVATLLAETRSGQSVYDDVLTRASILRAKEKNKKLAVYNVAQMMPIKRVSSRQARVEKVMESVKIIPAIDAPKPVLKLKTTRVRLRVKNTLSARVHPKKLATKAKAAPVASPDTNAPPAAKRHLMAKRTARVDRTKTKSVPSSRRARTKVSSVRLVAGTASKKPLKKGESTSKVSGNTDEAKDYFSVEDILAEGEGDSDELDFVDESADIADAPATAHTAPAKEKRKSAGHRAGRSHLLKLESMLPTAARSQKVIAAHTSTFRKAPGPKSASQSVPFTPARREVSFADNIRAQLASFL
ncbi:hypothetical protein GH5_06420 [Leishmania sp. Ghana 2012 LV757]|uniref:hypothetical protein n=1 Tax=Leishmania sp. Ghana 2012 LV757 TaxID=2803181 RepID=UPI001B52BC2E|nr:hypothetical protein GH5_06420 [Leishmania sp. Ghana 2012 LV757]